jgi:hypothetical protein
MRDASIPMLLTVASARLQIPTDFSPSPGDFWRSVECLGSGFFVVLMTSDTFQSDQPRAVVLCWDSDIVHFIESPTMAARVCALHHFKAIRERAGHRHLVREVSEIWRGVDTAAGDCEVILFKATDGSSFCGPEAIPVPNSVRADSLLAAVQAQPVSSGARSSDAQRSGVDRR